MPHRRDSASEQPAPTPAPRSPRRFRVLVVDAEAPARRLLSQCALAEPATVLEAGSVAEARRQVQAGPVDVMLVEANLPDGSGLALARELATRHPSLQTIVITDQPSVDRAIEALRLGAADFIVKPLDAAQVHRSLRAALERRRRGRRWRRKVHRLERLCAKLNTARLEVTQQVDMLCTDLVAAYQELAQQMNQVVRTGEFAQRIREELDLEQLLRRVLEFLLDKAGPTNAALFLPSTADEFSLGGYVNYECANGSPDVLLQHLADVVAPKMVHQESLLHLTDNEAIEQWIGDDWAYLADCHVLAVSCRHDGETLAVIVLFRDNAEPFAAPAVETLAALAPVLGDHLARLIRIHHRHLPDFDEPSDAGPDEAAAA